MSNRFAVHSTQVVCPEETREAWIVIEGEKIVEVSATQPKDMNIREYGDAVIMPGLVDSHVHINEPGRTEWEGFFTATQAALAGGVTTVVDMPLNSDPVTTTSQAFEAKLASLGDQLHVDVGFWGGVVPEHTDQLTRLVEQGVLGCKAFTCHSGIDDFPASDRETLRTAMVALRDAGAPLLVHAELEGSHSSLDESDVSGDLDDPTVYASYLASRPATWEVDAIALVIELIRETGCAAHIVHLSAATALPMIKAAKDEGLPLTVETCPHYLCLTAEEIENRQTQFKCAPPIRTADNRELLWDGLAQGIIDFVVSDHSPCVPELKRLDDGHFHDAWGGISSLQLGLSNIWTEARKRGHTFNELARWLATRPAQFAGLADRKGRIESGLDADLVIWSPHDQFVLQPQDLRFKHKLSPYLGRRLEGRVIETYLRGSVAYLDGLPIGNWGKALLGRGCSST